MKIIPIFADKLYSFQYGNETNCEYFRLIDNWNDTVYIYNFYNDNLSKIKNNSYLENHQTLEDFSDFIFDLAMDLDEYLNELTQNNDLNSFFKPLSEAKYEISIGKFKGRQNILRLYALKIDENCFIITGGGIKLTQTMDQDENLKRELLKLSQCQAYLKENFIDNSDTFFEFIN
jgi:hypothetical protein